MEKKRPLTEEEIKWILEGAKKTLINEEWEKTLNKVIGKIKEESLLYRIKFSHVSEERTKQFLLQENPALRYKKEVLNKLTKRIVRYKKLKSSKEVAKLELMEEGEELTEKKVKARARTIREWLGKRGLTYKPYRKELQ